MFSLPNLPFEPKAMAPILSEESFAYHHGKHHAGVVAGTNAIVEQRPVLQGKSLEEIIIYAAADPAQDTLLFNASQHWNHSLYWLSLSPPGSTRPSSRVLAMIEDSFGDMAGFKAAFVDASVKRIGSGWTWLIAEDGKLAIETTINYDVPLIRGKHVLVTCDVWEHTYYIDYRNNRKGFIEIFVDQLLNWDTIDHRLKFPDESLDPG
jgi:Fe-Mn family superoxide dismutase